jgi:hypothetical protein
MSLDVVMCFGFQARAHRTAVARVVRSVAGLPGALVEGCDVGVRTPARALLLRVRLREGAAAGAILDRLATSSAAARGFAVALRGELAGASDAVADTLQASDNLAIAVDRSELPGVVSRALDLVWPAPRCAARPRRLKDRAPCPPSLAGRRASRHPTRRSPAVPHRSSPAAAMP